MINIGRSPSRSLVTVFEVANETTRELYIAVTDLIGDVLACAKRQRLPPRIDHWRKEHRISYRCIERNMPQDDAREFVRHYAQSSALKGWKII